MEEATAGFILNNPWVLIAIVLWTIPWKGVALWRASRNTHLIWFIVMLVLNTLAIVEIIYIFGFSKPKQKAASLTDSIREDKE